MTVVSVLFVDTLPIIVADSLISTFGTTSPPPRTPLTENEDRPGLNGYMPSGTARKIWPVGERAIFLYSGNVKHAQMVHERIGRDLIYTRYDDEIHRRVVDQVLHEKLDLSFIVLSGEPDDEVGYYFHGSCAFSPIPTYGNVIAIGGGAKDLIEFLQEHPAGELPDQSDVLEYVEAATQNAAKAAGVLTTDYRDRNSVMAAASTGGYFEVIYPSAMAPTRYVDRISKFFGNGFVHIFTEYSTKTIVLNKIIISHHTNEHNIILTTNDNLNIPINEDSGSIPWENFIKMKIRETRDQTVISSFDGLLDNPTASHMIVYGVVSCKQCSGVQRTRNILSVLNGDVIEFSSVDCSLRFRTVHGPAFSQMHVRLSKFPPCPICSSAPSGMDM